MTMYFLFWSYCFLIIFNLSLIRSHHQLNLGWQSNFLPSPWILLLTYLTLSEVSYISADSFSSLLGAPPTSICHFFRPSVRPSIRRAAYLRNCTSSGLNFRYTYAKHISRCFFSFFQNFDFLGCYGGKRVKSSPKWKTTIKSVTCHI